MPHLGRRLRRSVLVLVLGAGIATVGGSVAVAGAALAGAPAESSTSAVASTQEEESSVYVVRDIIWT